MSRTWPEVVTVGADFRVILVELRLGQLIEGKDVIAVDWLGFTQNIKGECIVYLPTPIIGYISILGAAINSALLFKFTSAHQHHFSSA